VQDLFLNLELVFVAGVLVVASAAAAVILATRLDAMRGGLDDGIGCGAREAGLLLGEGGFDFLSREDKGGKHGFAASVGFIAVRSGGQTGEAVAPVDHLFDCEEQELILRYVFLNQVRLMHGQDDVESSQMISRRKSLFKFLVSWLFRSEAKANREWRMHHSDHKSAVFVLL
jgi:hypothetical protein